MAESCPCGSGRTYRFCCEAFHRGAKAPTAEALMRSRYSAFVKGEIDYLRETHAPETRGDFSEAEARRWSRDSQWLGLRVLKTEAGQAGDERGVVEFFARYSVAGEIHEHHEISDFRLDPGDGRWYFIGGRST